jgi:hypothetical protein
LRVDTAISKRKPRQDGFLDEIERWAVVGLGSPMPRDIPKLSAARDAALLPGR